MSDEIGDGTDFYDEGYSDDERSLNNRISFKHDKFYGREVELTTLHRMYKAVREESMGQSSSSQDTQLGALHSSMVIQGCSGAGKSSLVGRFVEELDQESKEENMKPFLFLSGKYEELQTANPFSAIVHAFNGLCQFLLQEREKQSFERVQNSIQSSLGAEANALCSVIPDLKHVLGESKVDSLLIDSTVDTGWNRLLYLFQKLLTALCKDNFPVILFLDDIQWADSASIKLIGALLKDSSLKSFMFIGALRADEVDKSDECNAFMKEIDAFGGEQIERIDLMNLTMSDIGSFIADTLDLEVEECSQLAELVYDKTRGNILFAMQTLEELHRKGAIYYDVISFRWEWNVKSVLVEGGLSNNLDDAVAGKLEHAPEKLRWALVLASYTRSTFDLKTLFVLTSAYGCSLSCEELRRLLDMAVLEGFLLHTIHALTYQFAHDRIQQAARVLAKGEERRKMRLLIGEKFFEMVVQGTGRDWMMFVGADHLNSCSTHNENSLVLANLNLLCGEKAISVAAYLPASAYLRLAIKSIRKIENRWVSQYDLSLRIFRALCDVELYLGNFESGDELAREVIGHTENLNDRLPTLFSLAVTKGRQHQHVDAYKILQQTLSDMGAVPRRHHFLHMLKDFHVVRRKLKRLNDNDILSLPHLKDERKKSVVKFLSEGQLRAYYCGDMVEFMFCCLRSLRITFKYGVSSTSAHSLATYGILMDNVSGDYEGALRMARLARKLLDRQDIAQDNKAPQAMALSTIGYFIEAWSCSRDHVLATGHASYQVGMESGNVETGFLSWSFANNFAFATGYPLDPVEKAGREIMEQMKLYNVNSLIVIFLEIRLPMRVFLGIEDDLDWIEIGSFEAVQSNKSDTYTALFGYLVRLEMALYFGKLEIAEKMSNSLQPCLSHESSYCIVAKNLFYSGLTHSGLARKYPRLARRYRSKASTFLKIILKFCGTKGQNILHKSSIMKADLLACHSRDLEKVANAYDEGIGAAIKIGFVQDAALASEIAGEYFLSIFEHERARQYICQAQELYKEWGADAKVHELLERRPTYVDPSLLEDTLLSSELHHNWTSAELTECRKSVVLDLLSCTLPRTELPEMSISASGPSDSRDRDEISILSDDAGT